ncbi:MAG TPA: zinc-binding dehydrogenase, partial [Pseudolabrys sp.]
FEAGACLGIPAMTGYHAIAVSQATKGTTLLISGGAGAVSQYAIQFAKAAGATVLATISSPEKAKAAQEVGADHTINYISDDVGARVMEITGKRGVDAVIEMDFAANAKLIPAVLRPKGSVIVYGTGAQVTMPAFFFLTNGIRVQFLLVYELDSAERERAVSAITRALEQGTLANRVAQPTYTLADIAAAHEAVERGTIGNVVVRL